MFFSSFSFLLCRIHKNCGPTNVKKTEMGVEVPFIGVGKRKCWIYEKCKRENEYSSPYNKGALCIRHGFEFTNLSSSIRVYFPSTWALYIFLYLYHEKAFHTCIHKWWRVRFIKPFRWFVSAYVNYYAVTLCDKHISEW